MFSGKSAIVASNQIPGNICLKQNAKTSKKISQNSDTKKIKI
jgi:hypothetical protein